MKVFNSIELIDLAIYINKTLIFTDFHIGYEEALNKQGLLIPRFQFPEIITRLDSIFNKLKNYKIDKIVVNGDIKHEFGTISDQEWRHTLKLLDYFGQHCKEIILVKGNHDTILGPIAKKRNVRVVEHYLIDLANNNPAKSAKSMLPSICEQLDSYEYTDFERDVTERSERDTRNPQGFLSIPHGDECRLPQSKSHTANRRQLRSMILPMPKRDSMKKIFNNKISLKNIKNKSIIKNKKTINEKNNNILITHGDKIPDKNLLKKSKTIIIGHEHPAVSIREGPRAELFKAYLIGKWRGKNLIAQPSFNLVTEGTDVTKEKLLSPFLQQNLGNFDVVVVADKMYKFGKLREL